MMKKTVAFVSILLATAFLCGYMLNPLIQHTDPKVNVYMDITKGESTGATATIASGNLITDLGEWYVRNAVAYDNITLDDWSISLSNDGSSSAAWTELPGEVAANGFTRIAGTVAGWTNSGDYAFNVTKTFTATGTQQLQTAGLQWNTTSLEDGTLFAAADFTQTTFEADDTLTVTWVVTFNAN